MSWKLTLVLGWLMSGGGEASKRHLLTVFRGKIKRSELNFPENKTQQRRFFAVLCADVKASSLPPHPHRLRDAARHITQHLGNHCCLLHSSHTQCAAAEATNENAACDLM